MKHNFSAFPEIFRNFLIDCAVTAVSYLKYISAILEIRTAFRQFDSPVAPPVNQLITRPSTERSTCFPADCQYVVNLPRCRRRTAEFQVLAFPSRRIRRDRLPAGNLLFSLRRNKFPAGLVSRPLCAESCCARARPFAPIVFAFLCSRDRERLYNLYRGKSPQKMRRRFLKPRNRSTDEQSSSWSSTC